MSEEYTDSEPETDGSDSHSSYDEEEPDESETSLKDNSSVRTECENYDYYHDEPEADEEWLSEYNQIMQTAEQKCNACKKRLEREYPVSVWFKCGNCSVEHLVNPIECQCCTEIDGCEEALNSELVLKEVETLPKCITQHPGFPQVCLQKWSLRLSAGKYRNKEKKSYKLN